MLNTIKITLLTLITQTRNLNLGVKCGKEFDEGVEFLSSIIIFNEVWMEKIRQNIIRVTTAVSFMNNLLKGQYLDHNRQPTGRSLALEIANQLDDLIHVVETLELTIVVDDLHWVFNYLKRVNLFCRCLHQSFVLVQLSG